MIVGNDQEGDDCVITAHVCTSYTLNADCGCLLFVLSQILIDNLF